MPAISVWFYCLSLKEKNMKKHLLNFSLLFAAAFSMAQVNLTANLKLCMPFSGNTNDLSGNNNNGTISGSVTLTSDRFNQPNKAYQFVGGTNDYIAISAFTNVATNNELSISIWAKVDVMTSTCLLSLLPDNSSDRCVLCAQYSGVGLIWDYGNISSGGRVTYSVPHDLNWHHYVYVISQNTNVKQIYMDGVSVYSGAYSGGLTNKNFPIIIGAGASNGSGGSLRWVGKIDDVSMYNRVLNQAEVTALYTSTTACQFGVGITEVESFRNFQLYPTASDDGVYNIYNDNKDFKLDVYSMEGKLIKQFTSTSSNVLSKVDINEVEAGMYIFRIYDPHYSFNAKVIKN
jgi:hypothetical protein